MGMDFFCIPVVKSITWWKHNKNNTIFVKLVVK